MPDLRTRLKGADRIPAPDLWEDIQRREPQARRSGRGTARRVGITALAFAVAAAGFVLAARGFSRGPTKPKPVTPAASNGMIWVRVGGGDGPSFVYEVDPASGKATALFNDGRGPDLPGTANADAVGDQYAWSPDGSQLAFSDYSGYGTEIFLMGPDGTHRTQLTHDQGLASFPSWSPDGTKVAYASDTGPPPTFDAPYYTPGCEYSLTLCPSQIFAINVDGTGETKLTHDSVGAMMPDWSPTGSSIAFVGGANDPNGDIYVMAPDGSDVHQLTSGPASDSRPQWSPDGVKIAFIRSSRAGSSLEIMNADGGDLHEIARIATTSVGTFAWSPDGTEIAYETGGDEHAGELFLISPDGTALDRINVVSAYGLGDIAWQPVPAGEPTLSPSESASPSQQTAAITVADSVRLTDPTQAIIGPVAAGEGGVWAGLWKQPHPESGASEILRIDPATDKVVATISELGAPGSIATGAGAVWVTTTRGSLIRIDPETNRVVASITSEGADLTGPIVVDGSSVWLVGNSSENGTTTRSIVRVDAATNAVATIPLSQPLDSSIDDIVVAAGKLWVASYKAGVLTEIDPATNAIVATVPVPVWSHLVAGPDGLWVDARPPDVRSSSWYGGPMLAIKVDPQTGDTSAPVLLTGGRPDPLEAASAPVGDDDLGVWLVGYSKDQNQMDVAHLNPTTGKVDASVVIPVAETASSGIAFDAEDQAIWLPYSSGTLVRVDLSA
jgi:WD40-like Beta Propeller Repeat